MKKIIDLHVHSNASDGELSPASLLQLASKNKISALALTDHDTVAGINEFLQKSSNFNIETIPGVEISVEHGKSSIHILGLFINHKNPRLLKLLYEIRKNRNKRNNLIIEKLKEKGFDISLDEVTKVAGGESVGRPHFAKILVEKGYFSTPQEVFDKCLKRGEACYCSRVLPAPREAIEIIHHAGGLAFWAHPMHRIEITVNYVDRILNEFIKYGLDGLEAYYTTFSEEQHKICIQKAIEYNLLISGGTDFHGSNMPGIQLGHGYGNLEVPYSLLDKIKKEKNIK